jgi:hypothetical protein
VPACCPTAPTATAYWISRLTTALNLTARAGCGLAVFFSCEFARDVKLVKLAYFGAWLDGWFMQ